MSIFRSKPKDHFQVYQERPEPIILEMKAEISKGSNFPISLSVDGKAHPEVSSGSPFGYGCPCKSAAEAKLRLSEYVKGEIAWFKQSYHRPVKVKLEIVNKVEQATLASFCGEICGEIFKVIKSNVKDGEC